MTLPSLATVPDLARRTVGDPTGIVEGTTDYTRAEVALEDASSAAREASGDLEAWPDPVTTPAPHPVVRVVLAAAIRWFNNPEAYTGESVGDSISYSRKAEGLSVSLTEQERRTCALYGPAGSDGGLGSLGTRRGDDTDPGPITVPVDDGTGDPLTWLDAYDYAAPDPAGG